MKVLNFLLFPLKLIYYIFHILYLDLKLSLKTKWIPIFEMFDLYIDYWDKTKNIDCWYKKSRDFLIHLINSKSIIDID